MSDGQEHSGSSVSVLAVVSLVLAIVLPVACVLAFQNEGSLLGGIALFVAQPLVVSVVGFVALVRINRSASRLKGKTAAWISVLLGCAMLGLSAATAPKLLPQLHHYDQMHRFEDAIEKLRANPPEGMDADTCARLIRAMGTPIWNTLNPHQCSTRDLQELTRKLEVRVEQPVDDEIFFWMLDKMNEISTANDRYFLGRYVDLYGYYTDLSSNQWSVLFAAYNELHPEKGLQHPGGFAGLRNDIRKAGDLQTAQ